MLSWLITCFTSSIFVVVCMVLFLTLSIWLSYVWDVELGVILRWVWDVTILDLIVSWNQFHSGSFYVLKFCRACNDQLCTCMISCRRCETQEINMASQNHNWFLLGHCKRHRCVFYHLVLGKFFFIAPKIMWPFRTIIMEGKINSPCFFLDGKIRSL